MSEELKPCPFCGGEAERITLVDAENFGGDVISCKKCECCTRVVFGEKEGLVEFWNRRAELSTLKAVQGEAVAWRDHSVNYAKGEKCPATVETLQAAWGRDQDLMLDQKAEISRLKETVNQLRQKRASPPTPDATQVMVPRELLGRHLKKMSCHPGMLFTPVEGLLGTFDELRAMLAQEVES